MAHGILLFLLCVSALLTPTIVFGSGSFSAEAVVAVLAIVPCLFVSVIGLFAGVVDIFRSRESRARGVLLMVLALILPGTMLAKKLKFEADYDASYAWYNPGIGGGVINFFLYRYVKENPSKVTYLSDDSEEVHVSGFIDSLRAAAPLYMEDQFGRKRNFRITSEGVFTPWGARVRFAVDRNHDGFLTAAGQRRGIHYGIGLGWLNNGHYSYSFATGVFLTLPDSKLGEIKSSFVTIDDNEYDRLAASLFQTLEKK